MQASQAPSSAHSGQPAARDSDLVAWVWQALVQMYGTPFLTAFGDEEGGPPSVWRQALGVLSWDEARTGLARLGNQAREYPPNCTIVLDACRPKPAGVRYLGRPIDNASRYLPKGTAGSRERIDALLQNMRDSIRTGTAGVVRDSDPAPAVSGCTCNSLGTCRVCRAYMAAASGQAVEFPRREPGEDG